MTEIAIADAAGITMSHASQTSVSPADAIAAGVVLAAADQAATGQAVDAVPAGISQVDAAQAGAKQVDG